MPKRIIDLVVTTVVLSACAVSCKGAGAGQVAAGNGAASSPPVASAPDPAPVSTPASDTSGGRAAGQGQTCDDGKCAEKLECVKYYGIAGGAGPTFTSCEIRCQPSKASGCPDGQKCITIADGPGSVCRPAGG